ncbi:hypothetical protein LCGC14_1050000 [marine sediment metagenome]|uniref:Uncharacterized protein n=1 Tax=marine sediment metagenome TaxID=412755 RepID=A0A0F9MTJ7_9ZZZZ
MPIIMTIKPDCPLCGCDRAKYMGFISINWDTGFTLEGMQCVRCDSIRQKSDMWCPEGMALWAKCHPDRREIRNGKITREWSGILKPKSTLEGMR